MAICHYSVSHVSRSTGCSSVQSAAYITGEKLHEERRGITANYSNRDDVTYSGTLAPEWAGDEFRDTEKAWNAFEKQADKFAETYYKTKETQDKFKASAQTGMRVVLAFPKELSAEDHKEILHNIMQKSFIDKGHVVTFGVHAEEGNPHAHLLVSHWTIEKDNTISSFKNRDLYSRAGLKLQREIYANEVNHILEKRGLDVRIDHRSYKDQGIDLIPTIHEGWYAKSLADKGLPSRLVEENNKIREENQQRIAQYPEIVFNELTSKRATFSELDALKVVQDRMLDHPELSQHVFDSVMEKAIHIGHGFDRHKRFTSPEYHQQEQALLQDFEKLSSITVDRKIDSAQLDAYVKNHRAGGKQMSEQQEAAVQMLCSDKAVTVLVGRAGTGKTTSVLQPVVALHQQAGFKVMGMALAAEAAKNLSIETGCKAETIAYYTYRWNQIPELEASLATDTLSAKERNKAIRNLDSYQKTIPTKDTVIIVDEAGMVGTKDWYQLVAMAYSTGAKLIVCGDDHQYKAVDAGDVLRKWIEVAIEKGCMAEVSYIFRQNPDWMKQASMELAQLETTTALMAYENKGHVREAETEAQMVSLLAKDYVEKIKNNCTHQGVVLTATNDTRLAFNKEIREHLQANGLLNEDSIQHQGKGLALGERIVFLENDRGQYHVKSSSGNFAVKNGTQGTIESIKPVSVVIKTEKDGRLVSKTQASHQLIVRVSEKERVTFTLNSYKDIDHAYALTGHKSQGQTVDWSMVHLSKNLDAYGLYVMMTRHRDDVTLYHNKEEVASFSKFADNIRVGYKDLAVDYTIKPENYEAYFNVEDYKALGREILQLIKDKGEKVNIAPEKEVTSSPSENHTLSTPSLEALLKERKDLARLIVDEREDHKLFVMQAGLTFEKLEITAGLKERPLTLIEQKAQVTVEQYGAVALEARNMWQEIRKTAPGSHAKSHPDYPRFDELRSERGSLANIIMEAQTLHRPFLKDITKDLGYGFTTIQKQAIEFQSKQLMQTLQQEGLDHGTSQKLNVLAAYVEARDQFAQTWKELKPQLKDAEGTLLKPILDAQVQSLRHLSNERDKLAYRIVDRFDEYHPLATSLQISLDTSKIFTQSENGHRQTCIEQYQHGNSQLAKGMAAFELNQLWQAEKEIGSKTTVRDLLQNKINLLEVRQEAQAFERIQLQGTLTTDQDKQLFKDLNHYQNIKDTARDHYKLCLEEATEKGIKPWETSYYPSYADVNKEKDAAAYTLIKQPHASVESMADKMSVSLKNLDQEAHRHDLRQLSDVYLSGRGSSPLAAQDIKAWLDFDRESGSKQTFRMLAESKGEFRQMCLDRYQHSDSTLVKSLVAFELNRLWQAENEIGLKITLSKLLQNNVNLSEIKSDAQNYERLQLQGSLTTDQDKQLFKDLSHYQAVKDTSREHYKLCLEEATEKGVKPWETSSYPSYAEVNKEKDAAAYTLIKQAQGNVVSMADKMSVSLKNLDQEAHRHDLRETSQIYLSGMGAHSTLAAKELRAWLDFDRESGSKQTVGMLAESKILPKELLVHIQEKEATFKQAQLQPTQLQQTKENISATPSSVPQKAKAFQSLKVNETPNLHESLKDRIVELSQTLLGDPSSRSAYQYRFGRKGSISVMVSGSNQGLYSNFESGVHGSPIKMIEEKLQLSSKEAIGWAKDWLGQTLTPTPLRSISQGKLTETGIAQDPEKGTTWTPILPVPSHAPKPDIKSNRYLSYMTKEREVTSVYTYKDQQGQTLGYVARLEDKDGSKITPTLTYCENEKGQQHWRWKGFGDNRPLYGLDRLAENKPVLIVEGEKAADAAQKLLPTHAVLSWSGGVGAINKADWSPLIGRDVTIWPDNDVPGVMAAEKITNTLKQLHEDRGVKCGVKTVELPKDLPAKWDLADKMPETLTVDKVQSLVSGVGEEKVFQPKTWAEMMKETAEEYKSMTFEQMFADIQRRNSDMSASSAELDKSVPFSSDVGLSLADKENHAVNPGIQTVKSEEVKSQSLVSGVGEEKVTQQKTWAEIMKETAEEYKSMTFEQVFADIQRRNSSMSASSELDRIEPFAHDPGLHPHQKDEVSGWGNIAKGTHSSHSPLESGKIGQSNAIHAPSVKPMRPQNKYDLATAFLKEYQSFDRAEKMQIITDDKKTAFEEKSLDFMKNNKEAYELVKSTYPEFGKRIEKIAMEQERSRELLQSQSRGFDFSR